ncbi:MAG: hypothetical protein IJ183_00170 [Prevotella sp.]|nr:hypothetical protein [Prevotella sp.]MBQ9561535.1 hypothetical protein [Prevotella sp.]MBR1839201.1 hypothetical protein [Prevotella sp.]
MKKKYIIPTSFVMKLSTTTLLAGSGPGAGDQNDPEKNSFDIDFEEEEIE